MAKCFFCETDLLKKEGNSKICVQMEDGLAIVENNDSLFCPGCNEYFLTSKQLVDSFVQIKESITKGQIDIKTGIYN